MAKPANAGHQSESLADQAVVDIAESMARIVTAASDLGNRSTAISGHLELAIDAVAKGESPTADLETCQRLVEGSIELISEILTLARAGDAS